MAGTTKEMSKIKQVLRLKKMGMSNRAIAGQIDINKETVNRYMRFIKVSSLDIDTLLAMDDNELDKIFHAGSPAYTDPRMDIFLEELPLYIEELKQQHVTRYEVWCDYKQRHPDGYGKSQFFHHLKQNGIATKDSGPVAVLFDTYVPGQKLMIDFAGDKLGYVDAETGECVMCEVFVASMPYSDYHFVMAVPSQRIEDVAFALGRCMEYLGGVPKIVTPDNLKSIVAKSDRYEPTITKAMEDMGNHYGFVFLPCQPRQPTQKALVENGVKIAYRRIYAKLRNRTFFSIVDLNNAIIELLEAHNQTRMQKRGYSREENFHANEKPLLGALPQTPYEVKYYATLTLQQNNHVELRRDKVTHFYSAPYKYTGHKMQVVYTRSTVRIYHANELVATHMRKHHYGYTNIPEHLAEENKAQMRKCSGDYISRAKALSADFGEYVSRIFDPSRTSNPAEVYYKTCDMLFSLRRRYTDTEVFDQTCRHCIRHAVYTGKRFEAILKKLMAEANDISSSTTSSTPEPTDHANMRGADYYSQPTLPNL